MADVEQEIESLKETLQTQQKLLVQLYTELEAEREASSSAASEALSMILRLQEEKAACQLEACQFKRMTEEKMNYADELQHVFQEIMHKKEMEIASLEFQLKAYHYKLLSLGDSETDFFSCPLSRIQSLPALSLPQITIEELSPTKSDHHLTSVPKISPPPPLRDHWEQIKELDQRVKGLSCPEPDLHYSCSTSHLKDIHDVFEVPQTNDNAPPIYSPHKRQGKKLLLEDHPDPFPNEANTSWTKQTDFQHLNQRLENLEIQTTLANQQLSAPNQDNLRLLKEIHQKLDAIQLDITSTKHTNHPAAAADQTSLVSLMEAMFFYSL